MRFLQKCRSRRCGKFFGILPEMLTGRMTQQISCPHCGHKNSVSAVTKKKFKLTL